MGTGTETQTELSKFLREVQAGHENGIEVSRQILDGKEKVTLCLQNRRLQPEQPAEPALARSPKRSHAFMDVQAFTDYVKREGVKDHILILGGSQKIRAVLDDRKADGGFEMVVLNLCTHPLFEPWERLITEGQHPLRDFLLHCARYRRAIVSHEPSELLAMFSQVRGSVNVTIQEGKSNGGINGVLVETKIQGQSKQDMVDLPESVVIECPIFLGCGVSTITIDLALEVRSDQRIYVNLGSSDLVAAQMQAIEQMLDKCREIDGAVVGLGVPEWGTWSTVREEVSRA